MGAVRAQGVASGPEPLAAGQTSPLTPDAKYWDNEVRLCLKDEMYGPALTAYVEARKAEGLNGTALEERITWFRALYADKLPSVASLR